MDTLIQIGKPAFLALINDVCARVVVDTRYAKVGNKESQLILVYSDGSEKVFKGLKAA